MLLKSFGSLGTQSYLNACTVLHLSLDPCVGFSALVPIPQVKPQAAQWGLSSLHQQAQILEAPWQAFEPAMGIVFSAEASTSPTPSQACPLPSFCLLATLSLPRKAFPTLSCHSPHAQCCLALTCALLAAKALLQCQKGGADLPANTSYFQGGAYSTSTVAHWIRLPGCNPVLWGKNTSSYGPIQISPGTSLL